ncbi:MmcQ/YjbR family DNA-binding protein [Brachybacterium hainanense]|uniref:MmcQ/YjbR family DNA-binding protein n=1 Tax=Brachybacterium hainanense TaxID=1541174 RepID=A0ABV6RDL6_9MICO
MSTKDDVRELALALPEVTEKPCYGTPAFYAGGRIFARMHEQPGVLVCWLKDLDSKEMLLAAAPEAFFTTDHYRGHASVLVRLEHVDRVELGEMLAEAWAVRAPARLRTKHGDG